MTKTKIPAAWKATVTSETRVVRIPRKEKIDGEEVVKGMSKKTFFDVYLFVYLDNGAMTKFVFVGHVFKGTARVIVRDTTGTRDGKDLSMTYQDFKRWLDQRWGYDKLCRPQKVQAAFAKFFGPLS